MLLACQAMSVMLMHSSYCGQCQMGVYFGNWLISLESVIYQYFLRWLSIGYLNLLYYLLIPNNTKFF